MHWRSCLRRVLLLEFLGEGATVGNTSGYVSDIWGGVVILSTGTLPALQRTLRNDDR